MTTLPISPPIHFGEISLEAMKCIKVLELLGIFNYMQEKTENDHAGFWQNMTADPGQLQAQEYNTTLTKYIT